jgi:hypothetical protein
VPTGFFDWLQITWGSELWSRRGTVEAIAPVPTEEKVEAEEA